MMIYDVFFEMMIFHMILHSYVKLPHLLPHLVHLRPAMSLPDVTTPPAQHGPAVYGAVAPRNRRPRAPRTTGVPLGTALGPGR